MIKGLMSSGSGKSAAPMDTLIGRQTEILGDVRFNGGLHLDGKVKGTVSASDKAASLSISEAGVVEGDVRVPNVVLNGTVIGDVTTTERLTLAAKARVTGNVYYKILQMEPGALINGQLVHEAAEPVVAALTHQKPGQFSSETVVVPGLPEPAPRAKPA